MYIYIEEDRDYDLVRKDGDWGILCNPTQLKDHKLCILSDKNVLNTLQRVHCSS